MPAKLPEFSPKRWDDGLERAQLLTRGLLVLIMLSLTFLLPGCAAAPAMPPAVLDVPEKLYSCTRHGDVIVCERQRTML